MKRKKEQLSSDRQWTTVIEPGSNLMNFHLGELWGYRDLVMLFVKRDFVTFYKQTVLGPLWYIIKPLMTTVVFTIIFGRVAKISTNDSPPFLFYLSGTVIWNYVSESVKVTSRTFLQNREIFGKVYFPRLTVPLSVVIINFVQFFIQFALLTGFYVFYVSSGSQVRPDLRLFALLPVFMLEMAVLGFGLGVMLSALTTKYRDLDFAVSFLVQIWMYASPVVYPYSIISEKYKFWYMLNPMASILESFRSTVLSTPFPPLWGILTGSAVTLLILIFGIMLYNRIEKTFMDTI